MLQHIMVVTDVGVLLLVTIVTLNQVILAYLLARQVTHYLLRLLLITLIRKVHLVQGATKIMGVNLITL